MAWRKLGLGVLLGLCICLCSSWAASDASAPTLTYTLTYDLTTPRILKVELEFSAPNAGEWRLRLGPKEGFVRHAAWEIPPLVLLSAEDAASQPLAVAKDCGSAPSCERQWRLTTRSAGRVRVRYWLYDTQAPLTTDYRSFSRPLLSRDFIHLVGFESLLYPEQEFKTSPTEITLTLRVLPQVPVNWHYFGNDGTSPAPFPWRFREPLPNFLTRAFAFGHFARADFRSGRESAVVIAPGMDNSTLVREVAESADELWKAAETIFGGPRLERESSGPAPLTLISLLEAPAGKRSLLPIAALHLFEGIVLAYNSKAVAPSALRATLKEELAHEIAHSWTLGLLTDKAEPWLKEGLAEFFGKRLLRQAGIWTVAEELASWKRVLNEAQTTPYAKASLATAQQRFWVDAAWHRLSYARGALAFYWLDQNLPSKAGKRQTLDEYVKNWQANGIRLDTSASLCQAQTIPECNSIIRNINMITNGSRISSPFPPAVKSVKKISFVGDELFGESK